MSLFELIVERLDPGYEIFNQGIFASKEEAVKASFPIVHQKTRSYEVDYTFDLYGTGQYLQILPPTEKERGETWFYRVVEIKPE